MICRMCENNLTVLKIYGTASVNGVGKMVLTLVPLKMVDLSIN